MYLSEVTLHDEAAARLMPANPYNWHQVIWKFFPDSQQRDFLYRVDSSPRGVRLMILSGAKPEFPLAHDCSVFKTKEIPESFLEHSFYRFQVRVNPTKRLKTDKRTGKRVDGGIRVPVTDEQELQHWLQRKGREGGFSLPALEKSSESAFPLSIQHEARVNFQKKGCQRAHHFSVQFAGVLQVVDTELFKNTFRSGIGSAKSFGFGLLMLQPLT